MGFALLLNTRLLGNGTKAFFRVVYILPWLFTVAIIAVLWRLLLDPNGVVNYLLTTSAHRHEDRVAVVADHALVRGHVHQHLGRLPVLHDQPARGPAGHPRATSTRRRRSTARTVLQRFLNVTIPQLRPIIISMALLDFIWTTQQFALIWMTTGGGPINVTEMLSTFTYKLAFSRYDFSVASASAVLILSCLDGPGVLLRPAPEGAGLT